MVAAIDIKIEVLIEFLNDLDTDCKDQNEFTCFVFDQNGFIIGSVIKYTQCTLKLGHNFQKIAPLIQNLIPVKLAKCTPK